MYTSSHISVCPHGLCQSRSLVISLQVYNAMLVFVGEEFRFAQIDLVYFCGL